jgi:hypothetical protein
MIEMLAPEAPVKVWRPSDSSTNNLNGSYPALDCYTVPESCKTSNENRMEKGLLSRDGWAIWDDINSLRMTPSSSNEYKQWHEKNSRNITVADLYFFGHGNQAKNNSMP